MENEAARHSADDSEVIYFETTMDGRNRMIAVDREAIEDHLGLENTTPEQRLGFVNQNMTAIIASAARKLRDTPDQTGTMLSANDLDGA